MASLSECAKSPKSPDAHHCSTTRLKEESIVCPIKTDRQTPTYLCTLLLPTYILMHYKPLLIETAVLSECASQVT